MVLYWTLTNQSLTYDRWHGMMDVAIACCVLSMLVAIDHMRAERSPAACPGNVEDMRLRTREQ